MKALVLAAAMTLAIAAAASAADQSLELASVDSHGHQGDETSQLGAISRNGRSIAYRSDDEVLTHGNPGADESDPHIFVYDQNSGETFRVDESSAGAGANRASYHFRISGNGRVVTFDSSASDLVAHDANHTYHTFAAPEPWPTP